MAELALEVGRKLDIVLEHQHCQAAALVGGAQRGQVASAATGLAVGDGAWMGGARAICGLESRAAFMAMLR